MQVNVNRMKKITLFACAAILSSCAAQNESQPSIGESTSYLTEETLTANSSTAVSTVEGKRLRGGTRTLSVGGQGTRGGSVPLSQWGMCGIGRIAAAGIDTLTVANISIDANGFYQANLGINPNNPAASASITVRCVNMSEFLHAPHFAGAQPMGTYENIITQDSQPFQQDVVLQYLNTTNSASVPKQHRACLWHGFSGELFGAADLPVFGGLVRGATTGFIHEMKLHRSPSVSTKAVCDGWDPVHDWQYELGVDFTHIEEHGSAPQDAYSVSNAITDLRVSENAGVCFIQGIYRISNDSFSAEVKVVNGRWFAFLAGSTVPTQHRISVHCISKDQAYQ
jgi:hypothetical protein